jgi:hypothetical protein
MESLEGMAGLTSDTSSPDGMFCHGSGSCDCKPEQAHRSANSSFIKLGFGNKKSFKKNSIRASLSVFKGREQKLNDAIFYVLSEESALAVWDILGHILHQLKGFKHTKYAIVNVRVKALESQGYLRKTGVRTTKQGGNTALYELTAKARLAMAVSSKSLDELINELDENSALTVLEVISKMHQA